LRGGEPLVRPDVFESAACARGKGLHVVLSTNGMLTDREKAKRFKDLEFACIGIGHDSAKPAVHDEFREMTGAFDKTMTGFRHCVDVGQKVGLRLTLTRQTCQLRTAKPLIPARLASNFNGPRTPTERQTWPCATRRPRWNQVTAMRG